MTVDVAGDTSQGGVSKSWPSWEVAARAVEEWAALQVGLLVARGRVPCRVSAEPEWWWASRATPAEAARQDQARVACSWCLVLRECAAYALAAREPEGVWGGMSPAERRARRSSGRCRS